MSTTIAQVAPAKVTSPAKVTTTKPLAASHSLSGEWGRRAADIAIAGIALVLLAPVLVLAAIAIRLTSRGPVVFRQIRVGKDGRLFTCYKFRTMVIDAEARRKEIEHLNQHHDPRTFKMKRDPRVTRVGALLRRFSVDEFPQLWNVLQGDMSLIGPRPPIPSEVAMYSERERQRLSIKPGLTCLWQVSGRSELDFQQQVELDIEYIKNRNLLLDLQLLLMTVPAVIGGRGAY